MLYFPYYLVSFSLFACAIFGRGRSCNNITKHYDDVGRSVAAAVDADADDNKFKAELLVEALVVCGKVKE